MSLALAIALMLLNQPLTDEQADAVLMTYLESDYELPATLPLELHGALNRFWFKEELWPAIPEPFDQARLKREIEWTRQNWPSEMPRLWEISRLPGESECKFAIDSLNGMRRHLDCLESIKPPWCDLLDIRCEVDSCLCFWDEVKAARNETGLPRFRRAALDQIRRALGDERWFSGDWPTVPKWSVE